MSYATFLSSPLITFIPTAHSTCDIRQHVAFGCFAQSVGYKVMIVDVLWLKLRDLWLTAVIKHKYNVTKVRPWKG